MLKRVFLQSKKRAKDLHKELQSPIYSSRRPGGQSQNNEGATVAKGLRRAKLKRMDWKEEEEKYINI
jgi:hypothetical protein